MREVGADVGDLQHVDQQLGELVGLRRDGRGTLLELAVALVAGHQPVLVAHAAGAGAGRHDDRVDLVEGRLEGVHERAHHRRGLRVIPGVGVHLPAAGLALVEHHLVAEPLEQGDGGPGDVRRHHVHQACGHQGDAHLLSFLVIMRSGG